MATEQTNKEMLARLESLETEGDRLQEKANGLLQSLAKLPTPPSPRMELVKELYTKTLATVVATQGGLPTKNTTMEIASWCWDAVDALYDAESAKAECRPAASVLLAE